MLDSASAANVRCAKSPRDWIPPPACGMRFSARFPYAETDDQLSAISRTCWTI